MYKNVWKWNFIVCGPGFETNSEMILRTGTRNNFRIWFLPTSGISSCGISQGKIISVNWFLCYRFFGINSDLRANGLYYRQEGLKCMIIFLKAFSVFSDLKPYSSHFTYFINFICYYDDYCYYCCSILHLYMPYYTTKTATLSLKKNILKYLISQKLSDKGNHYGTYVVNLST